MSAAQINPEMVKWRSQVQEKLNALHNNATKTKNTTINSNRSREGVNGGEDADILDLDGEKDGVSNDTAPKVLTHTHKMKTLVTTMFRLRI